MNSARPVYRIEGLINENLFSLFKKQVNYFTVGNNCFLFCEKGWKNKSHAKIFIAIIDGSVIYVDKQYSGMSQVLKRSIRIKEKFEAREGLRFLRTMEIVPSLIETKMGQINAILQSHKY